MHDQLKPIYDLNEAVNTKLSATKCEHPFVSKTISSIITKELYDNFLDHFGNSFFPSSENWAFMSISLKNKLELKKLRYALKECEKEQEIFDYLEYRNIPNLERLRYDIGNIKIKFKDDEYIDFIIEYIQQNLSEFNFETQELPESKPFFYDDKLGVYKNENLIQFSFIDFGIGIVKSLMKQYRADNNIPESNLFTQIDNDDVLRYAFKHASSCNPILDKFDKVNNYIPRGLFDLLVIVKRYKGLLIVRSNHGKILYDFSETDIIEEAVVPINKGKKEYFPGTYVSIYIPAWEKEKFNKAVIRAEYPKSEYSKKKLKKARNINLFSLVSEVSTGSNVRYKQLLEKLSKRLAYDEEVNWLTYFSFFGVTDTNIIKKTIFYLIGSNEINEYNCVILVHPPSRDIINEINQEILELDKDGIVQDFLIHPIPLAYLDIEKNTIELDWIGVFDEGDKRRLNTLLQDVHSLILSDLKDGYKGIGNTNTIDRHDNFSSRIPPVSTLLTYHSRFKLNLVENAIEKFDCIKKDGLYLCSGNYYQEEFCQLTDVLNDNAYLKVLSQYLFHETELHIHKYKPELTTKNPDIKYIAITASSHKLLESLVKQELIKDNKNTCIYLDSYLNFEYEIQGKLEENVSYILICDAISTGSLTLRLDSNYKKTQSGTYCNGCFS